MKKDKQQNRSVLSIAGQRSLIESSSHNNVKSYLNSKPQRSIQPLSLPLQTNIAKSQILFDPKQILRKLGLGRLRKMQALVRGFLCRRKVYPKVLKQYLIASGALNLIVANVIYRQVSSVVVQCVTLSQYDKDLIGEQRFLQQYLYNLVIKRVIQTEFQPVARQAVYQTALFFSRPTFTYGFNIRDPMQLLLFTTVNKIITELAKQAAEQGLQQAAVQAREMQIINGLIGDMDLIGQMCFQIISECFLQGSAEYVADLIVDRIACQGARIVAQSMYSQNLANIEENFIQQLTQQAQECFLQEAILSLLVEPVTPPVLPKTPPQHR